MTILTLHDDSALGKGAILYSIFYSSHFLSEDTCILINGTMCKEQLGHYVLESFNSFAEISLGLVRTLNIHQGRSPATGYKY